MVDAVIAWVDGTDPLHIEKRIKFDREMEDEWIHPKAKEPTRFANNNEIWYCVHSIRKYAPYIDRIFILTDEQQPEWLTEEAKKNLNIQMVDHKEIFFGFSKYLPTFNSLTIESMLHHIPGITNNFLYFNDDVILINPTKKSDYFAHDYLLYRGEWLWKLKLKQRLTRFAQFGDVFQFKWIGKGFIGYGNEEKYFKKNKYWLFRLAHAPHPMNKIICEQLFINQIVLEKQIKHRFKNKKQYIPTSLGANLGMLKGVAHKGPKDYGYLSCNMLTIEQAEKWLDLFDKSTWLKSLCIQSLDQATPEIENKIKSFLNNRLGAFELT